MDADRTTIAEFDAELIRRYDLAGPRYTSYPTAPQFTEAFETDSYLHQVQISNGDPVPKPISLYLHLPFCTNPCFYCGCTRIITRDRQRGSDYLQLMAREIELQARLYDQDRQVKQLHLGGGSPNFHRPEELGELVDTLAKHFRFAPADRREFGIEIDPRMTTPEDLSELAALGFNRVSMGIQDFDSPVQKAINRIQSAEATLGLIDKAKALGFRSINVDLIYGLPKQTLAGFGATLDAVIGARPGRIATYSYAHLPSRFKAQRQIRDEDLPSSEAKLALLQLCVDRLQAAGYVYIGMDHFALPDDELALALANGSLQRNFQGYSTHAQCDLIGLGMSAIGSVGDAYVQNQRLLPLWQQRIENGQLPVDRGIVLSADDHIRRAAIGAIMCQGRLDFSQFGLRHGICVDEYFAADLKRLIPLAEDGLLSIHSDGIEVSPRGRFLLRPIAMCFDAYLHRTERPVASEEKPRYSRVI